MEEQEKDAVFKNIESLKEEHSVSDAVFEGVKAANGWKPGKQVTCGEFLEACERFRSAPAGGRMDEEAKG